MASIPWNMFIEAYSQSMGVEKASELLEGAINNLSLRHAPTYSIEETKKIIDYLKEQGGLVRIIATTISTRLIVKGRLNT